MTAIRIFIGYDSREPIAYHVLSHSIIRHVSTPVQIAPLARHQLCPIYVRARSPLESTEFSLTRFLVPYLSDYRGISVYMDCDMLCLANINDMLAGVDYSKAVYVCQHNYTPTQHKFLGQQNVAYERKNWSSLMVFNNEQCRALTPAYIGEASGKDLHQFAWADSIGSLPCEWNWLVGEYDVNPLARIVHYTLGGPWFLEYRDCDYSAEWFRELALMLAPRG